MRTVRFALPVLLLGAVTVLLWPGRQGTAESVAPVEVVNFPQVQGVEGTVRLDRPIPQSQLVRLGDVVVSPVPRDDTTSLVEAGRIEAAGFTHVVLSLRGEVQGKLAREGRVGVVLLPDEEPVVRTFREVGRFHFPLEATARVRLSDRGYFAGEPVRKPLAFPRYRVLFYNETDRSVAVDLYGYLTN
ncbi:MAG: hypothetical protein PVG07_01900 [Acidobacteriota bacterium]|jgi:hypothetical protein